MRQVETLYFAFVPSSHIINLVVVLGSLHVIASPEAEYIAVLVYAGVPGVAQRDAGDTRLRERPQLVRLRDAVLVLVRPQQKVRIDFVLCRDQPVAIGPVLE